jgi:serine/threonine protein kinase
VRIARRKVRAFEQCQHPSVVPFVDVGTSGGMHYLAWPLVEGTTLEKVVLEKGKLSPEAAAAFVVQACEGLELCHRQELFHGMLKPSNLMVSPDGHIKILDFGIGCLLAETEGESLVDTMSTANSVNSGLDCASPESIMDPTNLTPIGDQYSLGCVLYFCTTGQYPFPDGTAVEKMMCHQHKQPTPLKELNPSIPAGLVAVVERLMSKKPEERYANCHEVIEALRPFASSAPAPKQTGRVSRIPIPGRPASNNGTKLIPPPFEPSKNLNGHGSHAGTAPAPQPAAKSLSKPGSAAERLKELRTSKPSQPATQHAQEQAAAPAPAPAAPAPVVAEKPAATPEAPGSGFRLGPIGLTFIVIITAALAFVAASFVK